MPKRHVPFFLGGLLGLVATVVYIWQASKPLKLTAEDVFASFATPFLIFTLVAGTCLGVGAAALLTAGARHMSRLARRSKESNNGRYKLGPAGIGAIIGACAMTVFLIAYCVENYQRNFDPAKDQIGEFLMYAFGFGVPFVAFAALFGTVAGKAYEEVVVKRNW